MATGGRALLPAVFVALSFNLFAQEKPAQPPPPAAAGPALKIGVNPWPPCQFWALAKANGIGDKLGVAIEVVSFPTWRESIKAFSEGKLDGIHEALATTIVETAGGGQPRRIAVATDLSCADGIVARSDINAVADLKGKMVGVETGTEEHYMLLRALDKAGLKKEAVTVQDWAKEKGSEALAAGKLDALVTWEPYLTEVKKRINGNVIYKTSLEEGPIVDVLAFSEKVLAARPDDVLKAVKVYVSAVTVWRDNPTASNDIMAAAQGVPAPEFRRAMAGIRLLRHPDDVRYLQSGDLEAALESTKIFLLRAKVITKDISVQSLIEPDMLLRAYGLVR
jgi:NitT/TauT family transport system substrate-binding protein